MKLDWPVPPRFLANVNVRLSSVMLVHPTQAVEIFCNIYTAFGTLAIHWHPKQIFTEIVPEEPFHQGGGINARGVAKYSDFGRIEGYI